MSYHYIHLSRYFTEQLRDVVWHYASYPNSYYWSNSDVLNLRDSAAKSTLLRVLTE